MPFKIAHQRRVVVTADHQLFVGNRQEFKHAILEELEKGERDFLIDFAHCGYVDSSGLGLLVSLHKKIKEHGGHLRLCNLDDELQLLLELTKVDTLFDIEA